MFKRILHTFGTRLATAVINFLIAVVVSQFLGAAGKGEQGILITTIALILIFSNIVGGASLVYLAPRFRLRSLLLPAYLWSLMMGFLLAGVFVALEMIPAEWFMHVALLSVLNSWVSIHSSLLIGKQKIGRSNLVNLFQSAFTIMGLLILIPGLLWYSVLSYIWSLYFAYAACLIISLIFILPLLRSESSERAGLAVVLKALFRFGYMNQLAHIAQILSFRISYFFLDKMVGEKSVGIYSNGVSLMESVWMISGSIALVQYADIANSNDKVWAQQLTAKLTRFSLWASAAVILPLVLLPPQFYIFLFGPEFSGVSAIMRWLAPGVFFFNYALVVGHYFSGTGKYYVNAIASGAGLIITVVLCYILIPIQGEKGAAIAAGISYLFTSGVVLIWFLKESKLSLLSMIPQATDLKDLFREGKKILGVKQKAS